MWFPGIGLVKWGAVLAVLAGLWWLFAPTTLGGYDTYAMVSGPSMWPRLVTGDLVILRPAAHLRPGEIAGYRAPELMAPIVHQIIAVHDGRFTFKGVNNAFDDPSHPTKREIVGRLWLDLGRSAPLLRFVKEPPVGGLLILGAITAALAPPRRPRRIRRRRRANAP